MPTETVLESNDIKTVASARVGDTPGYARATIHVQNPAAIGTGIYRRDLPGTCKPEEVHATGLEVEPSSNRLQEFVRCTEIEIESKGYFASKALSANSRWTNNSI